MAIDAGPTQVVDPAPQPLDRPTSVCQPEAGMGVQPQLCPDEEVRLAVVLYGGSSLCIYMNGVAQELLRLVQSTAGRTFSFETQVARTTEDLAGTPWVYRRLAQLANDDPGPGSGAWTRSDTLRRRFVIDILTGSSAGGINGLFLAKALANNQSLDQLKALWIEKGDLTKLFNDAKTAKDVGIPKDTPTRSLLDGRWMYWNILNALDEMGGDPKEETPLVRELDMFVTATDLYGVPVSVRLANGVAKERRHRQVFNFRYAVAATGETGTAGKTRNDFIRDNNPFLAFTARCTSSLPFVFQPMTLDAAGEVLNHYPGPSGRPADEVQQNWAGFYHDYTSTQPPCRPAGLLKPVGGSNFLCRPFGDGGSLDNSPFIFATEKLAHRHSEVPVSRKLLYVEPDPVTDEDDVIGVVPNALQNVMMQLVTLPRSQTISENLHLIKERNRVIHRIQEVLKAADPVLEQAAAAPDSPPSRRSPLIESLQKRYGDTYTSYRLLKVAVVVDDLATMAVQAGGLDPGSDEWAAVRALVDAWRQANYYPTLDSPPSSGPIPLDTFLRSFDLGFRLRRINFVERVASELDRGAVHLRTRDAARSGTAREQIDHARARLQKAGNATLPEGSEAEDFLKELRTLRTSLARIGNDLWRLREEMSDKKGDVQSAIRDSGITAQVLEKLLASSPSYEVLLREAASYVKAHPEPIEKVATALQDHMAGALANDAEGASARWAKVVTDRNREATSEGARKARETLNHYFRNYEPYDMLILPILYGTDAGESAPVEIFRVSPVDAPTLGDQGGLNPKARVAGNGYSHFGAFLEQVWRENDVMWGRMDAAGCIITALMPDYADVEKRNAVRDLLIREAHTQIVWEELGAKGRKQLTTMLLDELAGEQPPAKGPQTVRDEQVTKVVDTVARQLTADARKKLQALLLACLGAPNLLEYVTKTQQTTWELPARDEVALVTRGTHVLGEVFKGITGEKKALSPAGFISIAGRLGAAAAEMASPSSFLHLLARHWLMLLLAFEGLTILGGWFFHIGGVASLGLTALGLTAGWTAVVWIVGAFAAGKHTTLKVVLAIVLLAAFGLLGLFVYFETKHWRDDFHMLPLIDHVVHARP